MGRVSRLSKVHQIGTTNIYIRRGIIASRIFIGYFGGRDGIRTHDLLIANSGENKLRQGATIT
jgi:hypothetical protein